jgi:CRISPR-associated protein Csx10
VSQADSLREALAGTLYLGGGRSRGLGQVSISVNGDWVTIEDITRRVSAFNMAIRATLGWYREQDADVIQRMPGTLVSFTLHSPAIIEQFGRSLATISPEVLGLPQSHLVRSWARTDVATGWDSAAQLPRRTRLAIRSGSTFLYWIEESVERETLARELQRIEVEGIGQERSRGYGQVTVCAPFHTRNRLGEQH